MSLSSHILLILRREITAAAVALFVTSNRSLCFWVHSLCPIHTIGGTSCGTQQQNYLRGCPIASEIWCTASRHKLAAVISWPQLI